MEASRAVAVSIEHLSKTYPVPLARFKGFFRRSGKPPVEALRDVSLEVREGEIFGLIGPNGAGKTTLTKIIATLVQPTEGTVTVRGFDSVRDEERVRALIGLATAEERSFYWRLTALQNLLFFARLYGMEESASRRRIAELLNLFEFDEAMGRRRFGELSTGNKQRLAVARALLPKPPVLLLDEPTRSLDPLAAARLRSVISQLARLDPPVSVLLTSHNLSEVEELCDRVAIISQGVIRAVDTPRSLRARHKQTERVSLTLRGVGREAVEASLSSVVSDLEITEQPGAILAAFGREMNDDLLDKALKALAERGAEVLNVESERATLLDVLTAFQQEGEVKV
ncbi:MAG TPA: ABC transporter ATP-binding protein [Pyrinomonadaceae bacterium]|nr:ABC transporter ATP-binding protein [Pyrinomonadaceae bacterium]